MYVRHVRCCEERQGKRMILIIGGSGSGKSAYAEQVAMSRKGKTALFYLATMQVYDAEGEKKVARHRRMREGKGFFTIEQPKNIAEAAPKINHEWSKRQNAQRKPAALLECMSNLVANEMFGDGETPLPAEQVVKKITAEVAVLKEQLTELIVVTNNVFEDGIRYDATTMEYLRALGEVNTNLAAMADRVVEVVVGIPVPVRGTLEC